MRKRPPRPTPQRAAVISIAHGWGLLSSPVGLIALAVGVALGVWGIIAAAAATDTEPAWPFMLVVGAASVPTAWAVLETLWVLPGAQVILTALVRAILVPLPSVVVVGIAQVITVLQPDVQASIAAATREGGWHPLFSADDGSPLFVVGVLMPLANWFIAMLVGLVVVVVLVMPIMVIFRPRDAIAANQLDLSPKHAERNTRAVRALALVMFLVFAIPTAIIVGSNESGTGNLWEAIPSLVLVFFDPERHWADALWMFGILAIPLGLFAFWVIRRDQRADVAARAASGTLGAIDLQRGDGQY